MCRRFFFFICFSILLAACSTGHQSVPAPPALLHDGPLVSVTGKATDHRAPMAGVRVSAWPVESPSLAGKPPYVSMPTAVDGLFEMALPAGEYYFLARGEKTFAFYGRNPVAIPPAGLSAMNLGLVASEGEAPSEEPFVVTGVAGRVLHDGKPLSGAVVYVYTDLASRLKGMGYAMAGPTDEDGFFEAALPAGTYYLLARKRHGSAAVGPLEAGDFIGYFADNPLTVKEGEVSRVAVSVLEVPEKVETMQESLFGSTSIRGRILDKDGRPVSGARAVLYDDPKMLDRPLHVSRPTGRDGAYVLSFPYGGTYYLAGRDTLGGAPGPGDLYGTYDTSPDHSLEIKSGEERRDVDIVVEEMW